MNFRAEYFSAIFSQSPYLIWVVTISTFIAIAVFLSYTLFRPTRKDALIAQLPLLEDVAEIQTLNSIGVCNESGK